MTDLNERALEAAARALIDISALGPWYRLDNPEKIAALDQARAAVTAYLAEAGDGRLSELERENARMREALQLIANATHPRFLAEHDIHLLHVSEKTFGDCINIARAALAGSGE